MKLEFNIDNSSPEAQCRSIIEAFITQLEAYRYTTPVPQSELEWEIRVYKFMLTDPVRMLDEYGKARRGGVSKRVAVKNLGWEIS